MMPWIILSPYRSKERSELKQIASCVMLEWYKPNEGSFYYRNQLTIHHIKVANYRYNEPQFVSPVAWQLLLPENINFDLNVFVCEKGQQIFYWIFFHYRLLISEIYFIIKWPLSFCHVAMLPYASFVLLCKLLLYFEQSAQTPFTETDLGRNLLSSQYIFLYRKRQTITILINNKNVKKGS